MESKDYNQRKIIVPRFEESEGFYTTKERSFQMSRIRSKNSKPELLLRKALWAKNFRFRLHDTAIPGTPDIIIKKYKLVIFVDGEFWHGYNWSQNKDKIKSNRKFWIPKIERNIQKDNIVNQSLKELGYTVFRFWSNEIIHNIQNVVNQIELFIETRKKYK